MKKFNIKNLCLLGVLMVLFSACGGGIPKCGDKDVQDVLTDIILDNDFKQLTEFERKKLKFSYSGFMADMTDEESKTQHCKAQVKINGIVNLRPYKWDGWINYSARYTDDGMTYVEIYNKIGLKNSNFYEK